MLLPKGISQYDTVLEDILSDILECRTILISTQVKGRMTNSSQYLIWGFELKFSTFVLK